MLEILFFVKLFSPLLTLLIASNLYAYYAIQRLKSDYLDDSESLKIEGVSTSITHISALSLGVRWVRADLILMKNALICIHYSRFLGLRLYDSAYYFQFNNDEIIVKSIGRRKVENATLTCKYNKLNIKCETATLFGRGKIEHDYSMYKKQVDIANLLMEYGILVLRKA